MTFPKPTRKRIPKSVRERVKARFGWRCGYCGTETDKLQIDHIRAHYRGGDDSEENLMPACHSCNNYKHAFDLEQFRNEIQIQPERLFRNSCGYRLAMRFGLLSETEERVRFYFEVHRDV